MATIKSQYVLCFGVDDDINRTDIFYIEILFDEELKECGHKIYDSFFNLVVFGFSLYFNKQKLNDSLNSLIHRHPMFDDKNLIDYSSITSEIFNYLKNK